MPLTRRQGNANSHTHRHTPHSIAKSIPYHQGPLLEVVCRNRHTLLVVVGLEHVLHQMRSEQITAGLPCIQNAIAKGKAGVEMRAIRVERLLFGASISVGTHWSCSIGPLQGSPCVERDF